MIQGFYDENGKIKVAIGHMVGLGPGFVVTPIIL
jgi:hypothetical protein